MREIKIRLSVDDEQYRRLTELGKGYGMGISPEYMLETMMQAGSKTMIDWKLEQCEGRRDRQEDV